MMQDERTQNLINLFLNFKWKLTVKEKETKRKLGNWMPCIFNFKSIWCWEVGASNPLTFPVSFFAKLRLFKVFEATLVLNNECPKEMPNTNELFDSNNLYNKVFL